jgi:hypothetical protein
MLKNLEILSATDDSYKGYFSFIGSDSWGEKARSVRDYEVMARGAITITPDQQPVPGT